MRYRGCHPSHPPQGPSRVTGRAGVPEANTSGISEDTSRAAQKRKEEREGTQEHRTLKGT